MLCHTITSSFDYCLWLFFLSKRRLVTSSFAPIRNPTTDQSCPVKIYHRARAHGGIKGIQLELGSATVSYNNYCHACCIEVDVVLNTNLAIDSDVASTIKVNN